MFQLVSTNWVVNMFQPTDSLSCFKYTLLTWVLQLGLFAVPETSFRRFSFSTGTSQLFHCAENPGTDKVDHNLPGWGLILCGSNFGLRLCFSMDQGTWLGSECGWGPAQEPGAIAQHPWVTFGHTGASGKFRQQSLSSQKKPSMNSTRLKQRLGHLWQHKRPASQSWVMCSWQLLKGA